MLNLDLDGLLKAINVTASGITGIREAVNYDDWDNTPSGMFGKESALHLTGFPEEGQGWSYILRGPDLSEYEIEIPLYTVVITAAMVMRSRQWAAPYIERYRAAFDTRSSISGLGAGNTGSLIYTGGRVVRRIPDWPGYDGFYMLRHVLVAHVKGAVSRT